MTDSGEMRDIRFTAVDQEVFDTSGTVEGLTWYLAMCNPRCEARAQAGLDAAGIVSYRPMREVVRHARPNRGRTSSLVALLPRYLFVGLADGQCVSQVRACDGVAGLVSFNMDAGPALVAASEVRRVRRYELSGEANSDHGRAMTFLVGDVVRIIVGPFEGFGGTVRRAHERRGEVELDVALLGGEVPVTVGVDSVRRRA